MLKEQVTETYIEATEKDKVRKRVTSSTLAWESLANSEPGLWFAGAFDDACGC